LDALWKRALKKGKCLVGCKLGKTPCAHLDSWLNKTGRKGGDYEVDFFCVEDIETAYADQSAKKFHPTEGLWQLFKLLRSYRLPRNCNLPSDAGLRNHQIQLLIDIAVLGKSYRLVAEERGYGKHSTVQYQYSQALKFLREKGLKHLRQGE
jgi:hypothetical protein